MKAILVLLSAALFVSAQDIVFLGEPRKMITLKDGEALSKPLDAIQSKEFQCRITVTV
ncbi:MAG: hypothetical protein HY858_16240 [Candidatus Solibacter usitatus]|nr:hypothetical protein [Candidatus Solibacter usitatus]